MREDTAKNKLFGEFREILRIMGTLDEKDTEIYVLGLQNGVISSSIVAKETGLSKSSSGERLKKLADRGFFVQSLTEPGSKGGKGKGFLYAVVSPRIVLKDNIKNYGRMIESLGQIEEHLEVISEETMEEENIWEIKSNSLVEHFVNSINAAKNSIEILANDCTFADVDEIIKALREVAGRGVTIRVVAGKVQQKLQTKLTKAGINLQLIDYAGPTAAIIDEKMLYHAYRYGKLSSKYGALFTTNPYLIDKFLSLCKNVAKGGD